MPRLGFVINPLAGLGGRVGLKGSDGGAIVAAALARGAEPAAADRAAIALGALVPDTEILTAGDAMGEAACAVRQLPARVAYRPSPATTAADTAAAVSAFLAEGVDLVLFAGGDGTARDVAGVVGQAVPLIGIPAGVKMYSGVFAVSPAHAGILAARFLADAGGTREAAILDIDEDSLRGGRPATRLYGYGRVPRDPAIPAAKASAPDSDDAGALCRAAAADLTTAGLHIVGPGSTMRRLMGEAGLAGSLLGVDLVADGAVLACDVGEAQILAAMAGRPGPVQIHMGIIGGTGCLFGRGNQPISARVLAQVSRADIRVLATAAKLATLGPAGLFVDTGDEGVDRRLAGYIRVRTAPGRETLVRIRGDD